MNTFLPYPDISESVRCLDNKRLGKQRVEAKQILKALTQGPYIYYDPVCKKYHWFASTDISADRDLVERHTPWYKHPATQMWKGYKSLLEYYMNQCIMEWRLRGFENNMPTCVYMDECKEAKIVYPSWWGGTIHDTHKSNLLRKDPEWYGQFDWNVSDNLPYFWPTK